MSARDEFDDDEFDWLLGGEEISWPDITSPAFLDEFEKRQSGAVNAIPTFLPTWNHACGDDGGGRGLARGWFIVIAGNPGFGKTIGALLLARESVGAAEPAAFVSLEMHRMQLAARFYAMATGTEINRLEKGRFDPEALDLVRRSLRTMFPNGGLYTNAGLLFRLKDIIREMRGLWERGVKTFVVDYLQLVGVGDEEQLNKQITKTVLVLRAFAQRCDVRVILLSQFNRNTSGNYLQSPSVQGLHGGQIIEASADQVFLFDHSRYETINRYTARTWVLGGKNKHGPRVDIPIQWDWKTLTCSEGMPDEVDEGWTAADKERRDAKPKRASR